MYSFGNEIHSGTITNMSADGMFISTRTFFPLNAEFQIYMKSREKIIPLQAKVNRLLKTGDKYDGMGVELLNPPQHYLDLLKLIASNSDSDLISDNTLQKNRRIDKREERDHTT